MSPHRTGSPRTPPAERGNSAGVRRASLPMEATDRVEPRAPRRKTVRFGRTRPSTEESTRGRRPGGGHASAMADVGWEAEMRRVVRVGLVVALAIPVIIVFA